MGTVTRRAAIGDPVGSGSCSARQVGLRWKPTGARSPGRGRRRWRIYVFADGAKAGESSPTADLADWLTSSSDSPILAFTPEGSDADSWFDVKVIYQQDHTDTDLMTVPSAFKPRMSPFGLVNLENAFGADREQDIFDLRGIDRAGAIVVVRPDQYVGAVLPLTATEELSAFFRSSLNQRAAE